MFNKREKGNSRTFDGYVWNNSLQKHLPKEHNT